MMIESGYMHEQKCGTNMFSKKGKLTGQLYIAFQQEDPVVVERKRAIILNQDSRTDYTAGIVPGKPTTLQQELKYRSIQRELQKEDEMFIEKLKKRVERANNKNKVISKTNFTFKEHPQSSEETTAKEKALQSVLEGAKTASNFNQTFKESQ